MTRESRLHILLLSDGLPGHANQARGLVQWLSSRYRVDCIEIGVQLRMRALARLLLPWLLRMGRPGAALAARFYDVPKSALDRPQLIISAGGNTSFLNVALSRKWRVPNIFLGSKRRLRSDDFAAHLTLEPTGEPHNIIMELVPTPTDVEAQREAGGALRRELNVAAGEKLYALVIGGNGAGFDYDEGAWQQLARLVAELSARDRCRWLLTTSRRTGVAAETVLKANLDEGLLADAVWWHEAPRKVMSAYLGAADAVFVTADSMSMINECIASGKPTLLLEPPGAQPDARYRGAMERFIAANYCRHHRLGQPLPMVDAQAPACRDIRDRLLDALARQLALDS
ncbi:ELM1/GtrOC1 family putative glycosyltransferase [Marinobacterium aestuariivivens]|uniref:ELM1/GtrOC1 family putative glycosyltransferase n=1 Tax=Marinobacterium aestuariivivens TaxID=1698799 RepID=A0ABW1ZYS2_9GAMM